jgi:hypothetical protein
MHPEWMAAGFDCRKIAGRHTALDVFRRISFKLPGTQAEIDQTFGNVNKRYVVVVLRKMELV